MFCRFGLPKILVSDNAPQLTKSHEFERYCKQNGVNHIPIPSYHPDSNGQAESVVGKFKNAMKKMCKDSSDTEMNITSWLLSYHNTPHSATGVEPSVLMMGRRLRSPLSLVNPLSCSSGMKHQVQETTERVESEKSLRRFDAGDTVLYRDVLHKSWMRGTVRSVSDKIYEIEGVNGSTTKKHIDHVVASTSEPATTSTEQATEVRQSPEDRGHVEAARSSSQVFDNQIARPKQVSTPVELPSVPEARPKRIIKPPDKLSYERLGG